MRDEFLHITHAQTQKILSTDDLPQYMNWTHMIGDPQTAGIQGYIVCIFFFKSVVCTFGLHIIKCSNYTFSTSDEHRSAGGSWEEPVSTVRNAPLRRSQRLNSTLDSRFVHFGAINMILLHNFHWKYLILHCIVILMLYLPLPRV